MAVVDATSAGPPVLVDGPPTAYTALPCESAAMDRMPPSDWPAATAGSDSACEHGAGLGPQRQHITTSGRDKTRRPAGTTVGRLVNHGRARGVDVTGERSQRRRSQRRRGRRHRATRSPDEALARSLAASGTSTSQHQLHLEVRKRERALSRTHTVVRSGVAGVGAVVEVVKMVYAGTFVTACGQKGFCSRDKQRACTS